MALFKINTIPINDAIQSLEKGKINPVYYLMGEDQFLQQLFAEKLSKKLFNGESIHKTVLIPDEMSSKDILDYLTAADLFSLKKLFLLRNPNALKGKARDEFLDYIHHPLEGHTLIMMQDE